MFEFKRSNWSIIGNSGATVTVGTPTLKIQLGLGRLRLPVREVGSTEDIMLQGRGSGVSTGVAVEGPWSDWVNISGSPDFYPADGIARYIEKSAHQTKIIPLAI